MNKNKLIICALHFIIWTKWEVRNGPRQLQKWETSENTDDAVSYLSPCYLAEAAGGDIIILFTTCLTNAVTQFIIIYDLHDENISTNFCRLCSLHCSNLDFSYHRVASFNAIGIVVGIHIFFKISSFTHIFFVQLIQWFFNLRLREEEKIVNFTQTWRRIIHITWLFFFVLVDNEFNMLHQFILIFAAMNFIRI